MKTSLAHLPQNKQSQLKALTGIILDKIPAEMIILFGSYARGDWVEDYQEKYEYVSDFDILIVTKDKNSAKQVKKSRELEEELMANEDITRTSIIYHSIGFVNDKIERNYYFFVDILKESCFLILENSAYLSRKNSIRCNESKNRQRSLSIGSKVLANFWRQHIFRLKKLGIKSLPFNFTRPRKDFTRLFC